MTDITYCIQDLPSSVRRVASFLDKPVTEEQVARLCDHLSFDNFKKNQAVNYENLRELGLLREGYSFMRKGITTIITLGASLVTAVYMGDDSHHYLHLRWIFCL